MTVAVAERRPARKRNIRPPAVVDVVDVEVTEVADRGLEAHQLRLSGMPWAEVAQRTGYVNARVAQMAASAALAHAAATLSLEARVHALTLELDRLDALHAAVWRKALRGDTKAIQTALQVHDRRVRLLRLYQLDASATDGPRTIVIGGGDDMADQLRAAVMGAGPSDGHRQGQASNRG